MANYCQFVDMRPRDQSMENPLYCEMIATNFRLIYLLAPVVVVSEQHQTAGGYPVTVQHHNANMTQAHVQPGMPGAYPMPQPGSMSMPPNYNQFGGAQVPYPTNTPYPMGMPQPGVMPMPPQHQNPPSYNEVVGNEAYQKQAPFNPNFSS